MSQLMVAIHICSIYGFKRRIHWYNIVYTSISYEQIVLIRIIAFGSSTLSIYCIAIFLRIYISFIKSKIVIDNKEHYLCSNFFCVCMHASGNLILLISIRRSFYYTFEQWKSCREWEDSTWRECKKNNNDKKSHSRIIWCT